MRQLNFVWTEAIFCTIKPYQAIFSMKYIYLVAREVLLEQSQLSIKLVKLAFVLSPIHVHCKISSYLLVCAPTSQDKSWELLSQVRHGSVPMNATLQNLVMTQDILV